MSIKTKIMYQNILFYWHFAVILEKLKATDQISGQRSDSWIVQGSGNYVR